MSGASEFPEAAIEAAAAAIMTAQNANDGEPERFEANGGRDPGPEAVPPRRPAPAPGITEAGRRCPCPRCEERRWERHPARLLCAACEDEVPRDPHRSDLAVLQGHWKSAHRSRWLEMHPGERRIAEVDDAIIAALRVPLPLLGAPFRDADGD